MESQESKDKCAHPSCQCHAKNGSKYCKKFHCEGEAETSDIVCSCGHPACVYGKALATTRHYKIAARMHSGARDLLLRWMASERFCVALL